MKGIFSTLLPLVVTITGASAALQPIVIKGSKFFYENGTQFFMKGVAYQSDVSNSTSSKSYTDPLADEQGCNRDVKYLQELDTNIIRVYAIDPTKSHDACMKTFNDAGIYVISDLSEPKTSINRDAPVWDDVVYKRYTAVIDALAGYSNVVGFFAGNEVSNMYNNTDASAFVKAAIRDMKKYIKDKNYRSIPVGYATNDDEEIRGPLADYFNCGNAEDRAEFWGYNIYSWCGDSSYTNSGYDLRTQEFSNYSIPSFFAEYGCNTPPRKFGDVPALFSKPMSDVFSGGIIYMYQEEVNNYGLVQINGDTVKPLSDFKTLENQITKVNPQGVSMDSYTPSNTQPRDCPAIGQYWQASTSLPPTPDEGLCQCMVKGLDCIAKPSVSQDAMGTLFGYVCGQSNVDCSGILANGTTGKYGEFSMCSPSERLSWALNAYYNANGKTSKSCDFSGNATTQTAQSDSTCKAALQSASVSAEQTPSSSASHGAAAAGMKPLGYTFWLVGTVVMASVFAGAMSVVA